MKEGQKALKLTFFFSDECGSEGVIKMLKFIQHDMNVRFIYFWNLNIFHKKIPIDCPCCSILAHQVLQEFPARLRSGPGNDGKYQLKSS